MSMDPNEPGPEGFAIVVRTSGGYHKTIRRKEDIRGFAAAEVWIFGSPLTKAENELLREVQPAVRDATRVHYINDTHRYLPVPTPFRRTFTKDAMVTKMTAWMVETFGHPKELKGGEKDRWYERDGMLHHFITDLFND